MLTIVVSARKLRWHELGLLLRIAGMLLVIPVLQRVLTLPALLHLFDTRAVSPPRVTPSRLLALVREILSQRLGIFRPNCVKQSLILFHFLRRWGYPVQIYFGVAKHRETLSGHCWLELHGQPLAEPADPHQMFTVVYAYPGHYPPVRREPYEQRHDLKHDTVTQRW
jgi:hypothetical protein